MSTFHSLTQKIIATKTITPEVEQRLNQLLWSRDFTPGEMAILQQLQSLLSQGLIKTAQTQPVKVK